MKKVIAFLYQKHKNNVKTSNYAYLQVFTDIILICLFPSIFVMEIINFNLFSLIKDYSSGKKGLEYLIGIIIILVPLYILFNIFFPEKKLLQYYRKYEYSANYSFILRAISLSVSVLFLFLILKMNNKI